MQAQTALYGRAATAYRHSDTNRQQRSHETAGPTTPRRDYPSARASDSHPATAAGGHTKGGTMDWRQHAACVGQDPELFFSVTRCRI